MKAQRCNVNRCSNWSFDLKKSRHGTKQRAGWTCRCRARHQCMMRKRFPFVDPLKDPYGFVLHSGVWGHRLYLSIPHSDMPMWQLNLRKRSVDLWLLPGQVFSHPLPKTQQLVQEEMSGGRHVTREQTELPPKAWIERHSVAALSPPL